MSKENNNGMLFEKSNYILLIAGFAAIVLGLILMSGGGSENLNEFNYDEIFHPRRITIAPLVIIIGFGIVGYGILKKPKRTDEQEQA